MAEVFAFVTRWMAIVGWGAVFVWSIKVHGRMTKPFRLYFLLQAVVASGWIIIFAGVALDGGLNASPIWSALGRVGHWFLAVILVYRSWLVFKMWEGPFGEYAIDALYEGLDGD